MLAAQALMETRLLLRNGEQLLLIVVIPALLLVVLSAVPIVDLGPGRRVGFLAPGLLALAVLSTAFTGQAIAAGFDRRSGVLKRLGTSPLPRWGLIAAKTLSVLGIEAMQVLLLSLIALALGWQPAGSWAAAGAAAGLLALGTSAFSGLGLLMAGTLRAETTLAAANLVFLLFLVGGGVVVPLDRFPGGLTAVLELLPITALAEGLRALLQHGAVPSWQSLAVLAGWAVLAPAAAAATFRWD